MSLPHALRKNKSSKHAQRKSPHPLRQTSHPYVTSRDSSAGESERATRCPPSPARSASGSRLAPAAGPDPALWLLLPTSPAWLPTPLVTAQGAWTASGRLPEATRETTGSRLPVERLQGGDRHGAGCQPAPRSPPAKPHAFSLFLL